MNKLIPQNGWFSAVEDYLRQKGGESIANSLRVQEICKEILRLKHQPSTTTHMPDETNPTAETATAAEANQFQKDLAASGGVATSGITTHSDSWEREAAQLPNKDLHVPVTDPLFDKQTVPATIQKPEREAADQEGRGIAIRLKFKMDGELVSTEGIKRSPGYVFRPRPFVIVEPSPEKAQQAEIGQRSLNSLLVAAGVVKKGEELTKEQIYRQIGKLEGRQVDIKFATRKSTKKDPESGEFYVNQNLSFAAPGSQNGPAGGAAAGGSNMDY